MESSFKKIWFMPLVIASLTILGLSLALLGDGLLDTVSWIALTIPLIMLLRPLSTFFKVR